MGGGRVKRGREGGRGEKAKQKRREGKRFLLLLSTAAWHLVLLGTTEPLCASMSHGRRSPEAPAH